MTCGKIYKWTSEKSRDIPLPEIAQEILRCNCALIFKFFSTGELNVYDVIIGCKTKEDAVNLVLKEKRIDIKEASEKIKLWKAGEWFTERKDQTFLWDWSEKTPDQLSLPNIASSIITHQTDKIFRVESIAGDNEYEIVSGAKSKEDAIDVALGFWYDLSWDDDMDFVDDTVLEMRDDIETRTLLWTIGFNEDRDTYPVFYSQLKESIENNTLEKDIPKFIAKIKRMNLKHKVPFGTPEEDKYNAFTKLISAVKGTDLLEVHFIALMEIIGGIEERSNKQNAFYYFKEAIRNIELKLSDDDIPKLMKIISGFHSSVVYGGDGPSQGSPFKFNAFKEIFPLIKESDVFKRNFLMILDGITRFYDIDSQNCFERIEEQYKSFSLLVNVAQEVGIINQYYSEIESQFLSYLENIESFYEWGRERAFRFLIDAIKNTKILKTYFLELLDTIKPSEPQDYSNFRYLIKTVIDTPLIEVYNEQIDTKFNILSNNIGNFKGWDASYVNRQLREMVVSTNLKDTSFHKLLENLQRLDGFEKYSAFTVLAHDYIETHHEVIEATFLELFDGIWEMNTDYDSHLLNSPQADSYLRLLKSAEETYLLQKYFLKFFESIPKIEGIHKYHAFRDFMFSYKETELFDVNYSKIEKLLLDLLNKIDSFEGNILAFHHIVEGIVNTDLFNAHFIRLVKTLNKLTQKDGHLSKFSAYKLFDRVDECMVEQHIEALINTIKDHNDDYKLTLMTCIINIIKKSDLIITYLPDLLDKIDLIIYGYDKYHAFADLINAIKNKDLTNEQMKEIFSSKGIIETKLFELLDDVDKLKDSYDQYYAFWHIFKVYKGTKYLHNYFLSFLDKIPALEPKNQYNVFETLLDSIEDQSEELTPSEIKYIKTHFSHFQHRYKREYADRHSYRY